MRLPRNAGLCRDGSPGYADYYQLVEADPGRVVGHLVACDWRGFEMFTHVESDHVFIVGGSWNGLHHLTPLDGLAREMLAVATQKAPLTLAVIADAVQALRAMNGKAKR